MHDSERSSTLHFDPREIHAFAVKRLSGRSFARLFAWQALSEAGFRVKKRISFRSHRNPEATSAYLQMKILEFEGINARQMWSNWRTVPRNLNGLIADRPVFALDLCCGTGQSTEVLAWYLPRGSRILGLEYNSRFVEKASAKSYPSREGQECAVSFRAQSVLEPFRDPDGARLSPASVDLINSCGAVGFHFDASTLRTIAAECWRVLKPGGLALIDSGLPGRHRKAVLVAFANQGFRLLRRSRSCFVDPYVQTAFEKPASGKTTTSAR
ncbi:MAG: class I SAM-dependent methyltransferase [Oligoflexia bacterium]|nr:class I SAM-dependent methyltransferase [Oligoflexia bacterium]